MPSLDSCCGLDAKHPNSALYNSVEPITNIPTECQEIDSSEDSVSEVPINNKGRKDTGSNIVVDFGSERKPLKTEKHSHKYSKCLRVGLLNVNSINMDKYDYIREYLDVGSTSILALTEYVNSVDKNSLNLYLSKDDTHPIYSDPKCQRVGLAFPAFLSKKVSIAEVFTIEQDRKRKSNIVCYYSTFRVDIKPSVHISVVYLAPDSNILSKEKLFEKMAQDGSNYHCHVVVGDFNIDQKIVENKKMVELATSEHFVQKVEKPTRVSTKNINGKCVNSSTIIDLVFLNSVAEAKYKKIKIIKDSPSDHFLVELELDLSIPQIYTTHSFFLDPTRRPKISKANISSALNMARKEMKILNPKIENIGQKESMELMEFSIRRVLDKYAPLNKSKKIETKNFRFQTSRKFICLKHKQNRVLNALRKITKKLRKNPEDFFLKKDLVEVQEKIRKIRKIVQRIKRNDKSLFENTQLNDVVKNNDKLWDFINKNKDKQEINQNDLNLNIDGKTGNEMAEHMANYLYDRAHLVENSEITQNSQYIPYKPGPQNLFEFPSFKYYQVEKLYNPKTYASLACGPDTISQKHILDLSPAIFENLQKIINKPVNGFHNIKKNYTRLISKEVNKDGENLSEKSQRPIVEANILAKYGPIRIFIDYLQDIMIPQMNDNQFAFAGKGTNLAMTNMLDDINIAANSGKPTIMALWDFSNAFCTYNHEVIKAIVKSYQIPEGFLDLLSEYMEQSTTIVKMQDSKGFYFSKESKTEVGGPQGQIGTDKIYAISNDNMEPIADAETVVKRRKYVDDFSDRYTAETTEKVVKLLKFNIENFQKQASSTGMKLNAGKTKILPINCDQTFLKDFKVVNRAKTLGITFELCISRGKSTININPSADECISRLNAARKIVYSSKT